MKTVRLTSDGNIDISQPMISGTQLIKQNVMVYLKTKRSSYIFDKSFGFDVDQYKNSDISLLRQSIKSDVESIYGVSKVNTVSVTIDRYADTTYTIALDFTCTTGDRVMMDVKL